MICPQVQDDHAHGPGAILQSGGGRHEGPSSEPKLFNGGLGQGFTEEAKGAVSFELSRMERVWSGGPEDSGTLSTLPSMTLDDCSWLIMTRTGDHLVDFCTLSKAGTTDTDLRLGDEELTPSPPGLVTRPIDWG